MREVIGAVADVYIAGSGKPRLDRADAEYVMEEMLGPETRTWRKVLEERLEQEDRRNNTPANKVPLLLLKLLSTRIQITGDSS